MPNTHTLQTGSLNPSLLSFKPRQVLLLSNTTTAMKSDHKPQLLLSIARYLHQSGFSKTLKKFLKEAKLEKDDLGSSLYDLEKDFCEFLDARDDAGKKIATKKTEEATALQADGTSEGDGDGEVASAAKTKKRKSGRGDASGATEKIMDSKNVKDSKSEILKENSEVVDTMPYKKQKEQKKKKSKLDSESPVDNDELLPSELLDEARKGRKEESKVVDSETKVERKDKKKKTKKSSDTGLDNGKQDELEAKQEKLMAKQEEGGKKRKRFASENDAEQLADKKVVEESKRRKTEVSEKYDRNGHVDAGASQKASGKEFDAQANGNLVKNGESSAVQKSTNKQQNGSAEPHTAKRFQRVKVEEVVFSDERLKDNSYWAKAGAEIGYGAKAEEVLGQVKGRDFRHEKTKKKRGSYRGGQIDLQSHSVKFSYSDDE